MPVFMLPHCDLHMTLNDTPPPPLWLKVVRSTPDPSDPTRYNLVNVTPDCTFDFFAPYNPVGMRRTGLPSVNPGTGRVTANTPGIYLFNVQVSPTEYLVGRLQVHADIHDWWFGNSSIRVAKDMFAHATPSIYAAFSDDPSGADLVGDITGHPYVLQDTPTPGVFMPTLDGRLRGDQEGESILRGRFLNTTREIPVQVVDYTRPRQTLEEVGVSLPDASGPCHLLFLSEGFRAEDRPRFDALVTQIVADLFTKPRHAPFNLVQTNLKVWKAFEPSREHGVTFGFRVNDKNVPAAKLPPGFPIPFGNHRDKRKGNIYTVQDLVARVGLPLRTEPATTTKAELCDRWELQSLTDFERARVDAPLVEAWKAQTSLGILDARDTAFGFMIGSRFGDRRGRTGGPIPAPTDDSNDPNLRPFIARLYEWFIPQEGPDALVPDPRCHALERFGDRFTTNPGAPIMRYIAGLQERLEPHQNIGREWVPASTTAFSPSRGLVVLLTQDPVRAGSSVNARALTTVTHGENSSVAFLYFKNHPQQLAPFMRRVPTPPQRLRTDAALDFIAHELGHAFNLGDEYETLPNNDPEATRHQDLVSDNLTRLGAIFLRGTVRPDGHVDLVNDEIDLDKVKWLNLPRMQMSDVLIRDSETSGRYIKVTLYEGWAGGWVEAKKSSKPFAYLRVRDFALRNGRQLPFTFDDAHYLAELRIDFIDEAASAIFLRAPASLPAPFPVFPRGSLLYFPSFSQGHPAHVVEPHVLEHLKTMHWPLNRHTDVTTVNNGVDFPVDIQGFKPPRYAFRMIGVYEGAFHAGRNFRPAGGCKMRHFNGRDAAGEYCYVCKYLIVHRVAPYMHQMLDQYYYPRGEGR